MTPYNKSAIANALVVEQLKKWKRIKLFSDELFMELVKSKLPFYKTTNPFLWIGIFLLTFVLTFCSLGLFTLLFGLDGIGDEFSILMIIYGAIIYGALVFLIRNKEIFSNGMDDALLYFATILTLIGCIWFPNSFQGVRLATWVECLIALPVLAVGAFIFIDRLLSAASYCTFIAVLFFGFPEWFGLTVAKIALPFLTMAISLFAYYVIRNKSRNFNFSIYHNCFQAIKWLTAITFYAGGNYFVVRELSVEVFKVELQPGKDIPLAWFFYAFTCLVPLIYIINGLRIRSEGLINIGLILCVAAVSTIRYYHSIMPLEYALIIGGLVMIAIAVFAYSYLQTPKFRITKAEEKSEPHLFTKDIEAIVVSQILRSTTPEQPKDTRFGGGEFGGGGAAGTT